MLQTHMTFTLHDLEARVHERAAASPEQSYTRKLIDRGVAHCAKKLGEEAVETALAAVTEDREALRIATEIGFPVIIKASAGGGGGQLGLGGGIRFQERMARTFGRTGWKQKSRFGSRMCETT